MNVEQILRSKGDRVATIRSDATIGEAVERLSRERVGALVVSNDGEHIDGLLSERDIVSALAVHRDDLLALPIGDVMSHVVVSCQPNDSVSELMAEMTSRRIRHFPVLSAGRLCGIVSIGDLVKSRLDEIEFEADSLRSFIASA